MQEEEKQIEEMAKQIYGFGLSMPTARNIATYLTNKKGYAKASEVVNEVFADVFKAIRKYYIEAEHSKSIICELMLDDLKGDLAELKKKYTQEK